MGSVSRRRTVVGRLMDTEVLLSGPTPAQGSVIEFVPDPEQIYLEICDTIDRADHA